MVALPRLGRAFFPFYFCPIAPSSLSLVIFSMAGATPAALKFPIEMGKGGDADDYAVIPVPSQKFWNLSVFFYRDLFSVFNPANNKKKAPPYRPVEAKATLG